MAIQRMLSTVLMMDAAEHYFKRFLLCLHPLLCCGCL